jgi:hypothetical protein
LKDVALAGKAGASLGPLTVGNHTSDAYLAWGAPNQISDIYGINLDHGILETNGFSDVMGSLWVAADSAIDLGASAGGILSFAASQSADDWGGTLSIIHWDGLLSGGGFEQIRFGTSDAGLSASKLARISFIDPAGLPPGSYPAVFSTLNPGEIVPVPEPAALTLLLALPWLRRRRRMRITSATRLTTAA